MGSLLSQKKQMERNKRVLFLGTEAAGLVLAVSLTPWLGVPLMGLGAYFGWNWFQFRAKNGMRF